MSKQALQKLSKYRKLKLFFGYRIVHFKGKKKSITRLIVLGWLFLPKQKKIFLAYTIVHPLDVDVFTKRRGREIVAGRLAKGKRIVLDLDKTFLKKPDIETLMDLDYIQSVLKDQHNKDFADLVKLNLPNLV